MWWKKVSALLLVISANAWSFDVTVNGKPNAEIVVAANAHPGVRLAAEDLQHYIKMMSGAELPLLSAPDGKYRNRIFVGQSDFTERMGYRLPEFRSSGYDILIEKDYVVLAGPVSTGKPFPYSIRPDDLLWIKNRKRRPTDFPAPETRQWWDYIGNENYFTMDHVSNGHSDFVKPLGIYAQDDIGPWHAVSAFLEMAGVRFYAPYEDGTVIPSLKDIRFPAGRTTREAAFQNREFHSSGVFGSAAGDGTRWLKRLKGGVSVPTIFQHTSYAVFANWLQFEKHPEYFAKKTPDVYYEGFPADTRYPRFGNTAYREACLLFARKIFDAQPDLQAISLGVPDGSIQIDYRDLPEYRKRWKTDNLAQIKANLLWETTVYIARGLKKSHPGKIFFHWKHYDNTLPNNLLPDDPDNIAVPLIIHADTIMENEYSYLQSVYSSWSKLSHGRKVPCWDYFLYTGFRGGPKIPVFFFGALQRQMRDLRAISCGKFIEVITERNFKTDDSVRWNVPLMHLMMYLQMKLFWDPYLDVSSLLDEYYRLYFGPAAAEMKKFHEFAEAVWCRQESRSITANNGFLKEQDVPVYFNILEQALEKCPPGSVFRRRIEALVQEIEPLKKLFACLKRSGPVFRIPVFYHKIDLNTSPRVLFTKLISLCDNRTGEAIVKDGTEVYAGISADNKFIYVGAVCWESKMKDIKQDCLQNDESTIWRDDLIEIFLDTPKHSYFQIAVNPNGAIFDLSTDSSVVARTTLPILWSPEVKASVRKFTDRWEVLVKIPTEDFGDQGPVHASPWGLNIFRTRSASPAFSQALSPTGGKHAYQPRWGSIWK